MGSRLPASVTSCNICSGLLSLTIFLYLSQSTLLGNHGCLEFQDIMDQRQVGLKTLESFDYIIISIPWGKGKKRFLKRQYYKIRLISMLPFPITQQSNQIPFLKVDQMCLTPVTLSFYSFQSYPTRTALLLRWPRITTILQIPEDGLWLTALNKTSVAPLLLSTEG